MGLEDQLVATDRTEYRVLIVPGRRDGPVGNREANGSRTKVVITIDIGWCAPHLTLQRWEHYYPPSRPATRSFQPNGSTVQTVEVIHENGITRATGELTIPFEKVFRRAKRDRRETDIVVERHELVKVAEFVWRAQEFM
ncbi:hypothetical protein MferCBS31731_003979 [Microsporum ferrugineum]